MNRAISLSRGYRAACHLPAHYQNRVYDGLLSSAGPTGIAGNQEHLYVSASSPRVAGRGVPAQTGVCAFLIFVWLDAFVKRLYLFKAYCVGMCVCVAQGRPLREELQLRSVADASHLIGKRAEPITGGRSAPQAASLLHTASLMGYGVGRKGKEKKEWKKECRWARERAEGG